MLTDQPQGPEWWQASDLKWYPPEQRPAALPPPPAPDAVQRHPVDSTPGATLAPQQRPKPTRQLIGRDKLGVLTKIGQGGQGVVFQAPNVKTKFAASMVYKEYKPQVRTEIDFTTLAAMPALVEESLNYAQAERLISMAAWPCALVEDSGTPSGFVMPAIPDEFFIPLTTAKGVSTSTAEFQHLLNHSSIVAARGINIDDAQRYTLLREVASGLAFLHRQGVTVGDISPKNLLFGLAPREAVYFIDCDAMRIIGTSALPQVDTPGWDTPAGEERATIYTDAYKLGLLALRLLTGDQHTTNPGHLPATTPTMLRQIITDTLTNLPDRRPLPEAWTSILGNAIEYAQHRAKTQPPVSAGPAPPIPIVHSRPTAHSGPPVGPSAPAVPQPRPGNQQLPELSTPPPSEQRQPKRLTAAGIAAIVVTVVVLVVAAGITGYLLRPHTTASPSPAAQSTPPLPAVNPQPAPPVGPKPVEESALEGLLLTLDQINAALGATEIGVDPDQNLQHMTGDSAVADQSCRAVDAQAEVDAYAGSGWTAVRNQRLKEQGNVINHFVEQAVVLFPSAHEAQAFFNGSAQRWAECSNRQYTMTFAGQPDDVWTAGPVSNTNGTLSATTTMTPNRFYTVCRRALTVVNNVAIDVRACSTDWHLPPTGAASDIIEQIAAKVPTT